MDADWPSVGVHRARVMLEGDAMKNRVSRAWAVALVVSASACGWVAPWVHGAKSAAGDRLTAEVMREKLALSQQVLKGLALQDFAAMRSTSDRLVKLSQAGGWAARQTAEYELFTNEFRRAAAELSRAASEKNIDGATLAYTQMTISCVGCHKYMRGGRGPATGTPAAW